MHVIAEIVEAASDGAPMAIPRKRPGGGAVVPTVLLFHDGPGIRSVTHEFAAKLAAEGYDVLVPDLYHRHGRLLGWELHERRADPTIVDRLWDRRPCTYRSWRRCATTPASRWRSTAAPSTATR
ncbi:MAG: dienelactone hydrolase family protein, partial [Microbacteriaceae bacterium]